MPHIPQRKFDYLMLFGLGALHIGFVAGLIYWYCYGFYWISWILAIFFTIGFGLGISIGYHRMLTHKSLVCSSKVVRRAFIYFGGLLQNARSWVSNHRAHHAYTDTEYDPSSPYWPYSGGIKGFWWSHIGWLFWNYSPPEHIRNHILQNPDIVWEGRWHIIFVVSGFLLPFLIGGIYGAFFLGWYGFFWYGLDALVLVGIIRTCISLHITCSINSLGHMIGWRVREVHDKLFYKDTSRNNPFLALISFGEGNHASHHQYPWSARIGFLDPSWLVIRFFERLHVFHDVLYPPKLV